MTLTQMEYLIAVDTHRNFAEAARNCFITQPTLSMQIKKVEDELNVLLFDRSKKPVLTTDIGRLIIHQARVALSEANKIREIIDNQKGAIRGELRIGIIPTISPYLLPLFVSDFITKYPEVELIIDELTSDKIITKLSQDLLDAALMVTPINESTFIEMPLFYEKFLLYLSENHPLLSKVHVNYEDIDLSDILLLKEGNCFRNQIVNLCGEYATHRRHQLKFDAGCLETIKKMVDRKQGFTILPELAVDGLTDLEKRRVRQFPSPEPVREVSLVVRRNFMKKNLLELFLNSIKENIPPHIVANPDINTIAWRD